MQSRFFATGWIDSGDSIRVREPTPSCDGSSACSDGVVGQPAVPASEAVVFVIERSGLLQTSGQLDVAKREVKRAIDNLRFNTEFGVVFFDANVVQFPRSGDLLLANNGSKLGVANFVTGMPGGGGTCPQGGLLAALRMIEGAKSEIKRVVFMSSGAALCQGSSPVPAQILAAVRIVPREFSAESGPLPDPPKACPVHLRSVHLRSGAALGQERVDQRRRVVSKGRAVTRRRNGKFTFEFVSREQAG